MTSLSSVTIDSTGKLVFSRSLSPFLLAEMTAENMWKARKAVSTTFSIASKNRRQSTWLTGTSRSTTTRKNSIVHRVDRSTNIGPRGIDFWAETRCVIHLFLFGKCWLCREIESDRKRRKATDDSTKTLSSSWCSKQLVSRISSIPPVMDQDVNWWRHLCQRFYSLHHVTWIEHPFPRPSEIEKEYWAWIASDIDREHTIRLLIYNVMVASSPGIIISRPSGTIPLTPIS